MTLAEDLAAQGIGAVFAGRYALEERLARGASSTVYRARDREASSEVALKLLDARVTWDREARERLRREAVISRRIAHPSIVRVFDVAWDAERGAVVQELVRAASLQSRLESEGALPIDRALAISRGLFEALDACHRKGVIHRDLKPAHVLIDAAGRPRLIDFGIARVTTFTTLTRTGALLGNTRYQAPELLRGERVDLRADLYGVGLLLYEMLAGRPLYPSEARPIAAEPPDIRTLRPDVPDAIARLLATLLAAEPELRYDGALEALAALDGEEASGGPRRFSCAGCGHASRASLPFCARCGLFKHIALQPGRAWVRLRDVAHAEDYGRHLGTLFGASAIRWPALERLRTQPEVSAILARGVSRATADELAADARRMGAIAETGSGSAGLQLKESAPGWALRAGGAGLALLAVAAVVAPFIGEPGRSWALRNLVWLELGIFAYVAALIAALLLRSARPLLDRQRAASRRPGSERRRAAPLAARVGSLRHGPLAGELAGVVEAIWTLGSALEVRRRELPLAELEADLGRATERAFAVAERAAALDELLRTRSAADAHRDYERAEARRRAAEPQSGLAALEQALRDEVMAREEAEDMLAMAAGRLVQAAGALRRLERALPAPGTQGLAESGQLAAFVAEADAELAAVDETLRRLGPGAV